MHLLHTIFYQKLPFNKNQIKLQYTVHSSLRLKFNTHNEKNRKNCSVYEQSSVLRCKHLVITNLKFFSTSFILHQCFQHTNNVVKQTKIKIPFMTNKVMYFPIIDNKFNSKFKSLFIKDLNWTLSTVYRTLLHIL